MRAHLLVVLAATLTLTTGCGSRQTDQDQDARVLSAAADTSTCVRDAVAVTSTPSGYPTGFPLPPSTVLFHVEDRGTDGVIVTGVTSTPFHHVLRMLNGPAQRAGFKVTGGETEADDAEADWSGHGFTGRWVIEKSATCPGETVVQLASKKF